MSFPLLKTIPATRIKGITTGKFLLPDLFSCYIAVNKKKESLLKKRDKLLEKLKEGKDDFAFREKLHNVLSKLNALNIPQEITRNNRDEILYRGFVIDHIEMSSSE